MELNRRKCLCGCGGKVSPGKNYLRGHNIQNDLERRMKSSARIKGGANPAKRPEVRKKLSDLMKGSTPWNKGIPHTEETKAKISVGIKLGHTPEGLRRIGEASRKRVWTQESRDKCRTTLGKHFVFTDEHCRKLGLSMKGKKHSDETKKIISATMKNHLQDKEFCEKFFANRGVLPNKLELKVQSLLDNMFPHEYKYVGNFQTFIGGKCPDFMNINGQKKLIEVFGDYWHEGDDPNRRIKHFAKFGFKTLVLWEKEVNRSPKRTKETLLEFHND